MLSYEEFKEKLVTEVTVYAPEKYKNAIVDIMGVPKAEGNVDAIIMRMPDRNSGASLNCKDLYADYVKSNSFEKTMIRCLQSLIPYLKRDDEIDIQKIMNWEEVKEIIVPELVCTRRAGENLEDLIIFGTARENE